MPGNSFNPTTMWTPQGGWGAPAAQAPGPTTALPWMINNPQAGQPGQPDTIQDTSQKGVATAGSWTGANGLVTTGVMNPFGLNNPSSPWAEHLQALSPPPASGSQNFPYSPGGADTGIPGPMPSTTAPGMTNYNGVMIPTSSMAGPAGPPGAAPTIPGTSPTLAGDPSTYNWLKNVTSGSLDPSGKQQYSPTNPMQFADPATAALMARYMGTPVSQLQLQGPGMGFSQPMAQVGPGGSMNAGLLANQLQQYGSGPGSYGAYLAARDQAAVLNKGAASQFPSFDQWASTQPGYTPGTRATPGVDQGQPAFQNPSTTGGGSYNPGTPNLFGSGANQNTSFGMTGLPSNLGSMASQAWDAYMASRNPSSGAGGAVGVGANPPTNQNTLPGITGPYTSPTSTTPVSAPAASGPDAALAALGNNSSYLQNIVAQGGNPLNATPAWQAMVQAQQQQLQQNFANLQASFAGSGNRFSSDFGNAAQQYWNQAGANQNSLLGQMTLASGQAANNNTLQGATTLATQGTNALSQLSNQNYQALLQNAGFLNSNAQQQYNAQLQAALAYLQQGGSAASQLNQASTTGTLGLQQGSIGGANNLFQGGLLGAQGLYGTENAGATQQVQLQQMLQQMGLTAAQQASILSQSNLGLGNTIAQQQYGVQQQQASLAYQEWLRQQPQYSPLLPYMAQAATAYPPMYQPGYQPSSLGSTLGGVGGIAAAFASALPYLLPLLSDRRLKENIELVGKQGAHNFYKFNYLGFVKKYIGVLADEVKQTNPLAVFNLEGFDHVIYNNLGFNMMEIA